MPDVLVEGRVIPIPPGFRVRIVLEQIETVTSLQSEADRLRDRTLTRQPVDRRAGVERRLEASHENGARPPGTEDEPGIDGIDPLPTMAPRPREKPTMQEAVRRFSEHAAGTTPARLGDPLNGKPCPGCERKVGPRTKQCPHCGHRFLPGRKKT